MPPVLRLVLVWIDGMAFQKFGLPLLGQQVLMLRHVAVQCRYDSDVDFVLAREDYCSIHNYITLKSNAVITLCYPSRTNPLST